MCESARISPAGTVSNDILPSSRADCHRAAGIFQDIGVVQRSEALRTGLRRESTRKIFRSERLIAALRCRRAHRCSSQLFRHFGSSGPITIP